MGLWLCAEVVVSLAKSGGPAEDSVSPAAADQDLVSTALRALQLLPGLPDDEPTEAPRA